MEFIRPLNIRVQSSAGFRFSVFENANAFPPAEPVGGGLTTVVVLPQETQPLKSFCTTAASFLEFHEIRTVRFFLIVGHSPYCLFFLPQAKVII